jgi:hypothetical protein
MVLPVGARSTVGRLCSLVTDDRQRIHAVAQGSVIGEAHLLRTDELTQFQQLLFRFTDNEIVSHAIEGRTGADNRSIDAQIPQGQRQLKIPIAATILQQAHLETKEWPHAA